MTIRPDPTFATDGPYLKHDCSGCRYLGTCKPSLPVELSAKAERVELWLCDNERKLSRRFADDVPSSKSGGHRMIGIVAGMSREEQEKILHKAMMDVVREIIDFRDHARAPAQTETNWDLWELPNTPPWQGARRVLRAAGVELGPTSFRRGGYPEDEDA